MFDNIIRLSPATLFQHRLEVNELNYAHWKSWWACSVPAPLPACMGHFHPN